MADVNDRTLDVNIMSDDATKKVSVITDGAVERLAVDAGAVVISNDESPTKYQLKMDFDAVGDSVTTAADVTLYSFSGSGIIDFIGITEDTSSNYEVALVIDGVERFRITMSQLGSALGLNNSANPIYTETAAKMFRFRPVDIGFRTGFAIKAKATVSGTRTLKHIVLFREKVA